VAGFSDSAPTEAQYQAFDKLKKQTADLMARWEQVRNADIANFQKLASEQNIHSIYVPDVKSERVQGADEE
jgi:tryptophan synthase alpha subunit